MVTTTRARRAKEDTTMTSKLAPAFYALSIPLLVFACAANRFTRLLIANFRLPIR